jgi:hypothetical protein
VTLLYSSHDTEHNNAVALKEYIEEKKSKVTVHHETDRYAAR